MPVVPRVTQQVRSESLPNARLSGGATAAGFGAGIGETLANTGAKVYDEEVKKAEDIEIMRVNRMRSEYINAKMYDPKNGALTRKGRDSFSLPEEVLPDYDKKMSEIESTISSERVKGIFRKQSESDRNGVDLSIQRHVFQERERYDNDETEAFIKTSRDSATFNYADPAKVMAEIGNQVSAITEFATRNGKGPDWVKNQVESARSKTHVQVIERALSEGNDKYASAYYEEVKSDIKDDAASTQAAKLVQAGKYQGESQRIVDSLTKDLGGNRSAWQEEITKITDPKLRDAVQIRADQYLARIDAIQREDRESAMGYATQLVDHGGNFESIPVGIRDKLTVSQLSALRQYSKFKAKGETPETDWGLYYSLRGMASNESTMGKFANVDLMQHRGRLGDTEFKELVSIQTSIRKSDGKFADKIDGYRQAGQIVNDSLNAVGIDPTPKDGSDDAKSVARFRKLVDDQIIEFQRLNGRKPNTTEIQSAVDNLLAKGKVPGSGFIWNDSKRVFELKPGENLTVKVEDIPLLERNKIEDALKRNGKPVTNDEVIRLFNLKAQSMTAGK